MMSKRLVLFPAGIFLLAGVAVIVYFAFRSRPARYMTPLVIAVEASYPGADARTVADTVAAPIEEQINGVENMLSMSSLSGNDGSYVLHVTFAAGTDLEMAQVLVQNRVSLAMPILPALVHGEGIAVRKKSPDPLVLISVTSPDGRFDSAFLGNYAIVNVKDELARLPGVGDVICYGKQNYRMRVSLDADKLAARHLKALDVVAAISQQNFQVAAESIGQAAAPDGQQFQLTIHTLGQRIEPEQLESLIVKAAPDGGTVRLKDVARVERGGEEGSNARLNGKPAALLGIHIVPNAQPSAVSRAVRDKLAELGAKVPDGLALEVAFDFTPNLVDPNNRATPEHLVIDAELPEGASAERTAEILERAAQRLRKAPGIDAVLAVTEHPFSLVRNRPCLVARLAPRNHREFDREEIAGMARVALQDEIPEAAFRLSLPSAPEGFPVYGFQIEFAVADIGNNGSAFLREHADSLVQKMRRSGQFTDVGIGPCLRQPTAVERQDMSPIVRITANIAAGVPRADAKALCETLTEQEFGTKPFKFIWRTR
jgi:multidrug efflux pump subunit AcrB